MANILVNVKERPEVIVRLGHGGVGANGRTFLLGE